jgi:hypothetical protein
MNIDSFGNSYYLNKIRQATVVANTATVNQMKINKNTSLNSSMISRIHTAKQGCGSCGR